MPSWEIQSGRRGNELPFPSHARQQLRMGASLAIAHRPRHRQNARLLAAFFTMQLLTTLAFFVYLRSVAAHGGHEHDGPQPGETVAQYAARHVRSCVSCVLTADTLTCALCLQMSSEHHMYDAFYPNIR